MNTKKGIAVSLAVVLILVMAVTTVFAADAHFISASASVTKSGDLVVSWKEAGLGDDVNINYTASANATADYGCLNGGGNNPEATNKETVEGPVSSSGTFNSGKNGTISDSLTITPPPVTTGFKCPSGQKLVLADVSYTNVSVTDTTDGVSISVPGTFSVVFYTFK